MSPIDRTIPGFRIDADPTVAPAYCHDGLAGAVSDADGRQIGSTEGPLDPCEIRRSVRIPTISRLHEIARGHPPLPERFRQERP